MKTEVSDHILPLEIRLGVWKEVRTQLEYYMRNGSYDTGICNLLHNILLVNRRLVPEGYALFVNNYIQDHRLGSILDEFYELKEYCPAGQDTKGYEFWWPTHKDSMLIRMEVVDNIIMGIEEAIKSPQS